MNNTTQSSSSKIFHRKWLWIVAIVLITVTSFMYFSTSVSPKKKQNLGDAAKAIPVVTALSQLDDINVYLNGLGAVTPLSTVRVKSRIDGEIMKIYFKEGQMVKEGDLLAEIDPRPYQAALTQAEGQLMRDKALLTNALMDLERYRTLLKEESIASQQVDTQQSLVKQYEGIVKIDQGLLETAKLNLAYSKVTAPIAGRAGLRQADLGNVVHASDPAGIVVITQLQPMSVLFSLPEDSIPSVMKNLQSGKKMLAETYDRAFKVKIASGKLQTMDNLIDPTTGMVKLKAQFSNEDLTLFPSQFVNVKLLLEEKHNVITVPSSAIGRTGPKMFVFVVGKGLTVTQRNVDIGVMQDDKTEVVSGLQPNEIVVIDGADKLRDGAKVTIPNNTNNEPGGTEKTSASTSTQSK